MQHKMLELEIGLKIGPKIRLRIENKCFQFPRILGGYHLFVISTNKKYSVKMIYNQILKKLNLNIWVEYHFLGLFY